MFSTFCSEFYRLFKPPQPYLSCSDAGAELAFQVFYMNHSELESLLSALTGFPLFQIEEERERRKREGERKRLRRGKICKMKALAKERGKSMLLFTGKKKKYSQLDCWQQQEEMSRHPYTAIHLFNTLDSTISPGCFAEDLSFSLRAKIRF